METNYDSIYFYNKFSAIPEYRWCVGSVQNFVDGIEKRCAMGHCFPAHFNTSMMFEALHADSLDNQENLAMRLLFFGFDWCCVNINNGDDPSYQQPTPKQRIIAALEDIIRLEGKQVPGKEIVEREENVRVVYVTVDEHVRELQKAERSEN